MKHTQHKNPFTLIAATLLITLSACSSDDDPMDTDNSGGTANNDGTTLYGYSFNRTAYGPDASAKIERISLSDGNTVSGEYPSGPTDHSRATDGNNIYQIGRFGIDNIAQFDPIDTSAVGYQISLIDEGDSTTNPQSLVFVNENLAYLTRRATDSLILIDPTPENNTTESLIQGTLSLADYNSGTGDDLLFADMTDALLVGNKLFVLMENLNAGYGPENPGYLAVFDIDTNEEIMTGEANIPFNGIQLEVHNPTGLQYNEQTGMVYVVGRGNAYNIASAPGDPFTGGLEVINPDTYESSLLVDDGTAEDNNDHFNNVIVIDDQLTYVMTVVNDENFVSTTHLRTIDLTTGTVSEPIAGLENLDLTTIAKGPDNHIWIGIDSNEPGYMRLDLSTGMVVPEMVRTELIPISIVFLEVAQ